MKTINTIQPTKGMKPINCHQPLLPVSCSLLAPAAIEGSSVAKENKPLSTGDIKEVAALTRKINSTNHQNSGRLAVPLKSAYLVKQVLIAS